MLTDGGKGRLAEDFGGYESFRATVITSSRDGISQRSERRGGNEDGGRKGVARRDCAATIDVQVD
jgi:hypothetical protein